MTSTFAFCRTPHEVFDATRDLVPFVTIDEAKAVLASVGAGEAVMPQTAATMILLARGAPHEDVAALQRRIDDRRYLERVALGFEEPPDDDDWYGDDDDER